MTIALDETVSTPTPDAGVLEVDSAALGEFLLGR